MIAKTRYAQKSVPYYGNETLIVENHTTPEIVREIERAHKDYAKEYNDIAPDFWQGDAKSTARLLFDVCKKHITYDVEHPDNQSVKSPGAIFHQKHGDCKHYASVAIGVADALRRQGHNIYGKYRFVSDVPEQPVHHVFAVISDGVNDYWVDPVLSDFDTRLTFYNIKDKNMALYRISGTDQHGRPTSLPMVGKNNIFKQIAHGIEVNAANAGKAVKKAEHGVAVDAKNAGHAIAVNAKNAEHIVMNVGAAPARNAFLALLDLNAFNLATRMSEAWTSHNNDVKRTWKDLGGDENKLLAAINNGRKHKAYYHNQAPATHLSGIDQMLQHPDGAMLCLPVRRHTHQVRNYREAYDTGEDDYGRLPAVSGIGEPVSIATLSTLASAIIAAFAKFMRPDKGDQNSVEAAKAGVANLVQNASDAIDTGNIAAGQQIMKAAQAGADAVATMQVTTGVAPDGTPAVAVSEFSHPQLTNAGSPAGAAAANAIQAGYNDDTPANQAVALPDKVVTDVAHDATKTVKDVTRDLTQWVTRTWENFKAPIIFAVVGVGVYKIATHKKKRRR